MTQLRFGAADVAEIRFGVSPLWETVTSLWALHDPARHALHLTWAQWARGVARRPEVAAVLPLLLAYTRPSAWLPDCLTPQPVSPLSTMDEELDRLAATPPELLRADILATARSVPLSPSLRAAVDDPVGQIPALVAGLRAWWTAAVEPHWPRMRALLEADITYRARLFAEGGARRLFESLPGSSWTGETWLLDDDFGVDVAVAGRGLVLAPSVFADRHVLVSTNEWSPPYAMYPVRALGTLWETRPAAADSALARLVGSSRARVLAFTRYPASTTELAARTGLSTGIVSQHLGVLHDAGLVRRTRQGRVVLYLITDAGATLLAASTPADGADLAGPAGGGSAGSAKIITVGGGAATDPGSAARRRA